MNRALKWLFLNGIFAACIFFGFFEGIAGARNVALFFVWLNFFVGIVVTTGLKKLPEVRAQLKKGHSVPAWLDKTYDGFVIGTLVWHGYWISGIAYFIHMALQDAAFAEAAKDDAEIEAAQAGGANT